MSLYVIQKRCVATVDGKAVHYRPTCRVPVEIDDAVAATLGDAVVRYGADFAETPVESAEAPPEEVPAEGATTPEPAEDEKPRNRRRDGRAGGDDG